MVILLTGASGFIGQRLASALQAAGHRVLCAKRTPEPDDPLQLAVDFTRDLAPEDWLPRLRGVEVVVNAAGILRERGEQSFDLVHARAPCALFTACARAGVKLVLQLSALGADEQARSAYHLSKRRADDCLAALPVQSVILQPSLVYGPGGTSARLFTLLASLPLLALPSGGRQQVQPVHLDDVTAAVIVLLEQGTAELESGKRLPLVGPTALSLRDFLAALRRMLGLGRLRVMPVPLVLARLAATLAARLPDSLLDPDTLAMLERGNTASATTITNLLGRPPRAVETFVTPKDAADVRRRAQLGWLLPLLRVCIALVWIVTGIVSFGLFPVSESYALLARVGISGWFAPVMLYGAALLDLLLGIATLLLKRRHWLWLAQIALILFYTVLISWRLPEFWLYPYGPLLKNLPMLAALWLLLEMERR